MNHPVEQWWTKRQLALVEDRSRTWHLKSFEPGPAVERHVDGQRLLGKASSEDPDAHVIRDRWDHEHCELCSVKISRSAGHAAEGYTDGDKWICVECFVRCIQPRLQPA